MKHKNTGNMKNILKRYLMVVSALLCAVTGAIAQRSYTFNAVALNVDGLPNSIVGININPDGKEAAGATTLCGVLANSGWDFVGFSEDFNFHDYLTAAPASTYYNFGEHGGKVSGLSNSTDGLGFACLKHHTMSGGTRVEWGNYNGFTDQGADGLINKGFRVYTVTFATGVAVDVYILHMDADSGEKDIAARKIQLGTLATYIKNNHNNRPVIILGDTNCRYTRDELKTAFIDVINADSRFTIKDAWVEHMWGGTYPTYGSSAMMTDAYGAQKGEVVDKVFYINTTESSLTLESNSYLHDTSLTTSDHYPVVVNFTLIDPDDTAADNNSWQVNGGVIVEDKNKLDGCQVTDGTTYYIKNVSTGLYLNSGATWGTQACEGNAGMPITVTLSDGKYRLGTLSGSMSAVSLPYMDNGDNTTWTLQEVANTQYQYYLKISDTQALSSTGEQANANSTEDYVVSCKAFNADDDKQKWVLLTEERMKEEMANATASAPFDVTPLLKAAGFDRMDAEHSYASNNWPGLSFAYWQNDQTSGHNGSAQYISTDALTVSQVLSAMPAGTYTISFEGFYRAQAKPILGSLKDYNMTVPVSFGGSYGSGSVNLKQNTGLDINGDARWTFLDNDSWLTSFDVTTTAQGDMTLKIAIPKFSSGNSSRNSWIAVDNFVIKYKGDGSEADNALSVKTMVGNYINITAQKVTHLNAAGQAAYDITNVLYRYNNNLLSSDGQAEIAMIDAAYEVALIAHKRALVEEAINSGKGDVTSLIVNPSFETGDLTGWTVGEATDLGIKSTTDPTYAISNSDKDYMFYAHSGDDNHTSYVKQTIKGIPNGLYELKAVLASFGTADGKTHDYRMYLIGNDYHNGVAAVGGKVVGQEATLYFLVDDHTATIGAVGGNKGDGSTFIHYWPWEGCFFKADNFRLKYICDIPHGRLKLALDEANNATLDAYGKAALDISSYQAMYDNKSLTTDGKAEVTAIYNALQTAAKAQRTAGTDMTWAITNPNFETGDYTGWSTTVAWDTGVKPQENGTYTIAGTNGRYLFNTWNDDANATNSGVNAAITQTVTGLPNGTYKLRAMVASDNGNSLKLTGNGTSTTIAASTKGNSSGVFPEVECAITDGTLAITVEGVNSCWYKCDDFHLTLVTPEELVLNETDAVIAEYDGTVVYPKVTLNRTLKAKTKLEEGVEQKPLWNSFVVPFDISSATLGEEWEVKELTHSELDGDMLTLTFSAAEDGIKAGVPYMVRNASMTENLSSFTLENVKVNTTLNHTETEHVTFTGVYHYDYMPEGVFFINNNTFYQVKEKNKNKSKGYRAYIQLHDNVAANVRGLSYRTGEEEDDTDIAPVAGEVTVVAIYNTSGVRLDGLHDGINILQMSDGTTMKVVIK